MNKHAILPQSQDGRPIDAPALRTIVLSTLSYTPKRDKTIIIGADVTITLDGVSMDFTAGQTLALYHDVTYIFSISVPLGTS